MDDGSRRDNGNITNSTKYIISVTFLNKETIEIWEKKCYKNDKNCDLLADHILDKFDNELGRPFLFDKDCVSYEIRLHLEGYLWSIGKANSCPIIFTGYYLKNKFFDDEKRSKQEVIYEACKHADIYEADAATGTIEAGILGFNYFDGIASFYRNTKNDPYYNSETKKRSRDYTNPNWMTQPYIFG